MEFIRKPLLKHKFKKRKRDEHMKTQSTEK